MYVATIPCTYTSLYYVYFYSVYYLYDTFIIGRATLECLDVSANCFGDDGILMISEELIKQNDRLQVLGITNCGLSIKGV